MLRRRKIRPEVRGIAVTSVHEILRRNQLHYSRVLHPISRR